METISEIRKLERKRGLFFQIGLTLSLLLIWGILHLTITSRLPIVHLADNKLEDQILIHLPIPDQVIKHTGPKVIKTSPSLPVQTKSQIRIVPPAVENQIDHSDPADAQPKPSGSNLPAVNNFEFIPPVLPEFNGGLSALYNYLKDSIRYNPKAVKVGVEGVVYINFWIDENGLVSQVTVRGGVHPWLDNEAVRVVERMPAWIPGKNYDGSPVGSYFNLPIVFKLR
ncbi:MAG: TonB family protein [Bacteroidia bacterium]|nr:TonB family protein [Bacteroidia bacterium]MCZ2278428.1 TonB family protein [Bacteroidia bacterium]